MLIGLSQVFALSGGKCMHFLWYWIFLTIIKPLTSKFKRTIEKSIEVNGQMVKKHSMVMVQN